MSRTTRITEQLTWASYKEVYFIGQRTVEELARDSKGNILLVNGQPKAEKNVKFVNELQEAIDNGVFDKLVEDCAKQFHDGDIQSVLYSIARNLDSQACNMKKRSYAPNAKIDNIRLETMKKFVDDRRVKKTTATGTIPQWAFGPAELDQIDDPAALQKIINSISDVCCDKAHGGYEKYLGKDYVEVAKANRAYARKRKAELEEKANALDEELVARFLSGKKVVLTADEAAKIMKLLGK